MSFLRKVGVGLLSTIGLAVCALVLYCLAYWIVMFFNTPIMYLIEVLGKI